MSRSSSRYSQTSVTDEAESGRPGVLDWDAVLHTCVDEVEVEGRGRTQPGPCRESGCDAEPAAAKPEGVVAAAEHHDQHVDQGEGSFSTSTQDAPMR